MANPGKLILFPPGSPTAIKLGCKCPVIDNHYGRGYHGDPKRYVQVQGCPLHWPKDQKEPHRYDNFD